ncbi:DedA family protein [Mammaliicoccus sciuri]|uniref:DedA family protein n=2 Tax=Mammaliicoccus sciuri TaxID=1296 RepID=UPI001299F84E|nr:DedA family protein [Mammaliicoccus sciuri]MCD8789991.1 DedA family protein [Mammaliicoccus sciuri]MCD8802565.1 DedA family protein [Mammaliicoccus sciuri]MCY1052505.1 DedA family protein [Mammaliicoccus sciuri]MEB5568524.1 DedA family protein [Mammaliicoccus sciuri]MEB6248369.1 DedA family protein [Mammaliicoccus sciuri]
MESWITSVMEQFGYFGIALLILLENVFPPIPSEVILTFGGFMTTKSDLTVLGVVVASTIGSVGGAVILYWVGRILNVERIERIIEKWGKYLRLTKEDVRKADAWFDKYGPWTVFFCRFIPLIRSLISVPAGMSGMNQWLFLVLTTIGTLIWNLVLVLVGAKVGDNWHQIVNYMDVYSHFMYAVIAIGIIVFIIWFIRKKKVS